MATDNDLKQVIQETLESRGTLGQIKARLRAEVFNVLDDKLEPKPVLTNENLLINELIREYLEFNQYKYSSSVLIAESNQPKFPLDRDFIEEQLNVSSDPNTRDIPLLYSLVDKLKKASPNMTTNISKAIGDVQSPPCDDLLFHSK